MNSKFAKAYAELERIGAPIFTNSDNDRLGNFSISGEDNSDVTWASYYDSGYGVFGVNPRIDAILTKHGLFCEWANPGKLNVYVI